MMTIVQYESGELWHEVFQLGHMSWKIAILKIVREARALFFFFETRQKSFAGTGSVFPYFRHITLKIEAKVEDSRFCMIVA